MKGKVKLPCEGYPGPGPGIPHRCKGNFHFSLWITSGYNFRMPGVQIKTGMRIRAVGCSGSETPGRNFASYLLDEKILFDAGSVTNLLDIEDQMKIEAVFITHTHLDHVKCIPFLADNVFLKDPQHKGIVVAAPAAILEVLKRHIFNGVIWPDFTSIPSPEAPMLQFVALKEEEPCMVNNYSITPYRINHNGPAVGYLVEEQGTGKRLFYSGDTGPAQKTWKMLGSKPLDCFLIDVSFPNAMERQALASGHLTPSLLKRELETMQHKPGMVWAIHSKPFFLEEIARELEELGIENLGLLAQGQQLEF